MERQEKPIPVGVEDFETIRKNDFYYIDKTDMIQEILHNDFPVTLFTRPRRFGKTLTLSMLKYFFSPEGDKSIFDGLKISRQQDLCEKYMGKYPVIPISLKDADAPDYETALYQLASVIGEAAGTVSYLRDSLRLDEKDKDAYLAFRDPNMSENVLADSLRMLSQLLEKHHGTKVILLIDEYDVPLQKAYVNGYSDQMGSSMRRLFGSALKTNVSLKYAVLTGCLPISKESIFAGLHSLKVHSVSSAEFQDAFGFTDREVKDFLQYFGFSNKYRTVKEWYDGYRFGNTKVYCPWDVLNYCFDLRKNAKKQPEAYWIDTSGNDAVRDLIQFSVLNNTENEIEQLLQGKAVAKTVSENLTLPEFYESTDHLWSLLYMTGYLTQLEWTDGKVKNLVIPNREVLESFSVMVQAYVKSNLHVDRGMLGDFCSALENGDPETAGNLLARFMETNAEFRDIAERGNVKENFYQALLLTILSFRTSWETSSKEQRGSGYADIIARPEKAGMRMILEMKYAHDGNLAAACEDALERIEKKRYDRFPKLKKVTAILRYGIAFFRKDCKVVLKRN